MTESTQLSSTSVENINRQLASIGKEVDNTTIKKADAAIDQKLGDKRQFLNKDIDDSIVRHNNAVRLSRIAATSTLGPFLLACTSFYSNQDLFAAVVILAGLEVPLIAWLAILRADANRYTAEISKAKFERQMLEEIRSDVNLYRSLVLYSANDAILNRYHILNISQNFWAFLAGLFCIAAGLIMALGTLWLIRNVFYDAQEIDKIIVATIGGIGSILSEYVAAIALRLYVGSVTNFRIFHAKLVKGGQMLLGNYVVQAITNTRLRERTLARLSLELVRYEPWNTNATRDKRMLRKAALPK